MRSFTYDGSDIAGASRLEQWSFTQAGYRGEVGDGGFNWDNPGDASDLVGLKSFVVDESDSSPTRFFSGAVADRAIGRGPFSTDSDAQWAVSVVDENTFLDDILIRDSDGGNRPAETDVARVTWLLGTAAMSGITGGAITSAGMSMGSGVQMDANDYRRQHPRDVLDACAEISGKNFYVRDDGSGRKLWYYDPTSASIDVASGALSNDLADLSSTTFAPAWGEQPALTRDPARVYSAVSVGYDTGASVGVDNSTTESTFRRREIAIEDDAATTASVARTFGNQYLTQASTEEDTVECPVLLPSDKLGLFRPGQRVSTNFTHLGGSIAYRISRITWELSEGENPDLYLVTMTLTIPKITRFSGRTGGGGGGTAPASNPFVPLSIDTTRSFWQADSFEDGPVNPHYYVRLDSYPDGVVNLVNVASPVVYPILVGRGYEVRHLVDQAETGPPPYTAQYQDRLFMTLVNPGWDGEVKFSGAIMTSTAVQPSAPVIRVFRSGFDYVDGSGSLASWTWTDPSQLSPDGAFLLSSSVYIDVPLEFEDVSPAGTISNFQNVGGNTAYVWMVSRNFTMGLSRQFIIEAVEPATGHVLTVQIQSGSAYYTPIPGQPVALAFLATGDGSTVGYTTAYPYKPGSLIVLVDRIDWSNEVTETDPTTGAFTFIVPPAAGDLIEVRYIAA